MKKNRLKKRKKPTRKVASSKRKRRQSLTKILTFLVLLVCALLALLWWKIQKPTEETLENKLEQTVSQPKKEKYLGFSDLDNQAKGLVLENKDGRILIEEVFPQKTKFEVYTSDQERGLELTKIVLLPEYSGEKMNELHDRIVSLSDKRGELLTEDSPNEKELFKLETEILDVIKSGASQLVEEKPASLEEFLPGREITFSRLKAQKNILTVYPLEFKIYFPD